MARSLFCARSSGLAADPMAETEATEAQSSAEPLRMYVRWGI